MAQRLKGIGPNKGPCVLFCFRSARGVGGKEKQENTFGLLFSTITSISLSKAFSLGATKVN
ncbi:hypothetical protein NC652_012532 [Populus alba x Populus x berolinensis]|uniref:Uncharacterized protein n=1 Tax=Populus alba x Populus x berolinensis TaxID=444605 RepID=A0AAD6QT58_9ROSI|nr:hypothetical protein NC652_012532 [Populus alba x Populus x berolinensis]KAJ6995735.1 hypothetical protein NC653_012559 [Populus alba x Populus x berolinensis]